jgi:hypothetical protein
MAGQSRVQPDKMTRPLTAYSVVRGLVLAGEIYTNELCPRQDSNLRTRLRRAVLYPLSYGGSATNELYQAPRPTHPRVPPWRTPR